MPVTQLGMYEPSARARLELDSPFKRQGLPHCYCSDIPVRTHLTLLQFSHLSLIAPSPTVPYACMLNRDVSVPEAHRTNDMGLLLFCGWTFDI